MDKVNTFNTRIRLKTDTTENWKKIESTFKPLSGELIIYSATNNHGAQLKVGDGEHFLAELNFIDAGTVGGETIPEAELVFYSNSDNFPLVGDLNKLYIDLSSSDIYYYSNIGYKKIADFNLMQSKTQATKINSFNSGTMTHVEVTNACLKITNGTAPTLNSINIDVVNNVTKG